ncbi:hypothetical protein M0811_08584 [Anaeramoeba ignava]|uniref:Fcf2 pre-rRNA processing C-terminal domain-containing protein n=1 Tax=Anaeramoeba ignava TaxID=1746090 RepID=A0A9Q0RAU5_ANAIG|nr:hypothetical protein M0811_08584 [Anaeramoeba ignava]
MKKLNLKEKQNLFEIIEENLFEKVVENFIQESLELQNQYIKQEQVFEETPTNKQTRNMNVSNFNENLSSQKLQNNLKKMELFLHKEKKSKKNNGQEKKRQEKERQEKERLEKKEEFLINSKIENEEVKKALEKSILKEIISSKETSVPPLKIKGKKGKTTKSAFHEIPEKEVTPEIMRDFKIIMNRKALDPKRFYKSSDYKHDQFPKRFYVGTVLDSPFDSSSDRIPRRQRAPTLAEQLLKDRNFKQFSQNKMKEINKKLKSEQFRRNKQNRNQNQRRKKRKNF